MPALHQIGSIETLLSNSPLSTSKLWWRDIKTITGAELHAFVARMGYEGYGYEARSDIKIALGEVRRAASKGEVGAVPMLRFELPETRITTGEVRMLLARVSVPRRKAILFALEADMTLDSVLSLRWSAAFKMKNLSDQACLVLHGMPRYIKGDLVFWEYGRFGAASPLFGLSEQFASMAPNMTWGEFARQYKQAIPYDYAAELESFRSTAGIRII